MSMVIFMDRQIQKFVHEVKNPLNICNGYLEMAFEENSSSKKYLSIIRKEILRAIQLLDDYSKKQFDSLNYEEFDLVYLLEDVEEVFTPSFVLFFKEEEELYMEGDYQRLKQAFLNILKNAYEARSKERLLVVVRIVKYFHYYQVWIMDNGCGMDDEELKKIKNEYYTTKEEGTGLGVSYSNDVILSHRGDLFYQSRKDVGTRVIVTLPKEKSPKTFSSSNSY